MGLTPIVSETPFSTFLPLAFLVIIVVVASRFGNFAGMIGTITAALVFCIFLFEPRFSLLISDPAARNHLIWMVIIGVVISDLLGAYAATDKNTRKHS